MQQRLGLGEGLLGVALLGSALGSWPPCRLSGPWSPASRACARWYDGALALPLARHAGAGAEPVLARGRPHATRGGERRARRGDERSGRRGRARVWAFDHVLLSCGLELRRPRRSSSRRSPGFPRVGPLPHFTAVAILSAIAFVGAYGSLLPSHADASEEGAPAFVRPTRALLRAWDHLVLCPSRGGRYGRLERRLPGRHLGRTRASRPPDTRRSQSRWPLDASSAMGSRNAWARPRLSARAGLLPP